jgi:V/A-type H+/Na+-transporting ATPase subunit F
LKKIAFITPEDARFGFGLAGMPQYIAGQEEAEERLREIVAESAAGLIIIDERIIKGIDEEKMREIEDRWHGILLVLPSPVKPTAEVEDYAVRLIRRAIGYHVRLKM